jgi:hypothetical protein
VAQRLQDKEPNGEEIMNALRHKMKTLPEADLDMFMYQCAILFAGYYHAVRTSRSTWAAEVAMDLQ